MFDAFVAFRARMEPETPAVITPGRRSSFAALDRHVSQVAAALAAEGLSPASGVAAADAPDAHDRAVLLLALARLGVASAPADDRAAERRLILDEAWFAKALAAPPAPIPLGRVDPSATGRMVFSSEGRRIGLSWRMVEADMVAAATPWLAGKGRCCAPAVGLETRMGLAAALAAWACGAVVAVGWEPGELPVLLETADPDLLLLTQDQLERLLAGLPKAARARPGLRTVVCGRLTQAVAREARLRLGGDLRTAYGAAETGPALHFDAARLDEAPGAAGYPGPDVRLEVVEVDGTPLPPGELGEVRVLGPRVGGAFRDGGFAPGDMGRLAEDGLLVLEGRVEDRLVVAGRGLLPGPIEAAARACDGVADAAVFTAPDAASAERLWLAVVQGEGFERERLAAALQALPGNWPPVRFAWVADLPIDAEGRVDRAALRAEVAAATAARGA